MDKEQVDRLRLVLSLNARVMAGMVLIEGMKAANEARRRNGYADAYDDSAFSEVSESLDKLADALRDI